MTPILWSLIALEVVIITTSRDKVTIKLSSRHLSVFNVCITLRWRHNDHAGVSNHQPHGCLLNRLFRLKSKITSKLRVTGLCAGNSPGTGEFPAQMASYAKNVSIWWRHHEFFANDMHTVLLFFAVCSNIMDNFVCAPSQRETTAQCIVFSHWQGAFTKHSLQIMISQYKVSNICQCFSPMTSPLLASSNVKREQFLICVSHYT